jgi:hypothetical protein
VKVLLAGVVALSAVVCIVSVLYLTGPKTKCPPQRPGVGGGLLCLQPKPTNPWERISGAITDDDHGH